MEEIQEITNTRVKKNSKGYGYKYTDLSQIHGYLEEMGIRYIQTMETDEKGDYIVTIPIINGKRTEPIRGCRIPETKLSKNDNPAQEYGASLTYARRYSLLMAFGLATEDDDAECLTQKKAQPKAIPQVNKIQPARILKDIPGQNISNKQDDKEIGKARYLEMKKIAGESNEDILHEALKNEGLSNTKMLGTINEQTYEKVKKQIIDMITMINEAEKEMNGVNEK